MNKISELKNIIEELSNFDNSFSQNYKNESSSNEITKSIGYLLNLKTLNDLKDKYCYNIFKNNLSDSSNFELYFYQNFKAGIPHGNYEEKIFITSKELIEALEENNEYVLVNPNIWKMTKNTNFDKKKGLISYEINSKFLILFINNIETLYFSPNSSIISKNSFFKSENLKQNEINKIYKSISVYFMFETNLINDLKQLKVEVQKEGYLISKKWLNDWKKYSDYENIKKNFLSKNLLDENNIKQFIIKNFIKNKTILSDIQSLHLDINKIFIKFSKGEEFAIVNSDFFNIFGKNLEDQQKNKIRFFLKNKKIIFHFNESKIDDKFKEYYSYNNIISIKIRECFKIVHNLIDLYIYQENIKLKIIKNNSDNNLNNLILVDKKWISFIKKYYNYDILCEMIRNTKFLKENINNIESMNDKEKYYFLNKLPYLSEKYFDDIYNKKNSNEEKYSLEIKEKIIDNKNIKFIDNFELIRADLLKNLISNNKDKDKLKNEIMKDALCYNGENKLLIVYEIEKGSNCKNYIIGYINEKNSFISEYIIEYSDINILNDILNRNGLDYILIRLKEKNNSGYYDIFDENNNLVCKCRELNSDKDYQINEDSLKLLKLYIYYQELFKEINCPIKNKGKGEIKSGYFIKKDFMTIIGKLKDYQIIEQYISNNDRIKSLFNNELSETNEIFLKKLTNEFDQNTIYNINSNKGKEKIYSDNFNLNFNHLPSIKIDKDKQIKYFRDFFIFNEEIYNLFKSKVDNKNISSYNYFCADNRIIVLINNNNQKSIEIYKINEKNEFEIEFLFNYEETLNLNEASKRIIEIGCEKFLKSLSFNKEKDLVSPIFNQNQQKIGNIYKYIPSIEDYTEFNMNPEIKKLLFLYIYYKQLGQKFDNNNIEFKKYYIVNEEWIQEYKNYFNFNKLSEELEKINEIQDISKNCNFNNINFNNTITDKELSSIIKKLPIKIIKDFNQKENEINDKYKNKKNKAPNLMEVDYQKNKNLFYFYNFEIIHPNLYDDLFLMLELNINTISIRDGDTESFMMDELTPVEFGECIFDKNKILVKLESNTEDNKIIIEVGELSVNHVFEPEFFLIYYDINTLKWHTKYLLEEFGLNNYSQMINNRNEDTLEITDNNHNIIGLAIKRNRNIIKPNNEKNIDSQFNQNNIQSTPVDNQNNFKNSINNQIIQFSIKDKFNYPPKVGLVNIGSTCYMNATLQCFCQIEELASFFKYSKYVNTIIEKYKKNGENCLTASFKKLIDEIWPDDAMNKESNNRYFKPHEFKEKISVMDPLFANYSAKDAKDLLNFIIMRLHNELNEYNEKNVDNNNDFENELINQTNMLETFKSFYKHYIKTFRSYINNLLFGINQTETTCLNCKIKIYNFQTYFFLIFPLEKVKEYAINKVQQQFQQIETNNMYNNTMYNMNNNFANFYWGSEINFNNNYNNYTNYNMNSMKNNNEQMLYQKMNCLNNNIVNIFDCFEYQNKLDVFTGDNSIFCNNCQKLSDSYYCNLLLNLPKVLIIILNRGKGIEFNIKLEFTEILNLNSYIQMNNTNDNIYKLIGVITHIGNSGEDGHFIAHCLSPIDNQWYTYNDAIVNKITEFQKIIDFGMPYLLFYKKIEK